MKTLEAFNFLKDFFIHSNQNECFLYYNIKKDKFETFTERNRNRNEWQISLGIWSYLFDIPRLEKYLNEIKYKWSLYDLEELTDYAKSKICNGAGPKGYGLVVPDLWFENAANYHDLMYTLGGTEEDRLWADKCFLWRMQESTKGMRNLGFFIPSLYYRKVRKYGKSAFYHGEKRNIIQLNKIYCKKP